jgi:hypothetical protein
LHINGHLTTDSIYYSLDGEWQKVAYRPDKKAKLSAYLPADSAAATTIGIADTWYFINGNFVNEDGYCFGFDGDTVQYIGADTVDMEISLTFSVATNTINTEAIFGVLKNDSTIRGCTFPRTLASTGDYARCSVQYVIYNVAPNDKIKLVTQADKACALTFTDVQSTIKEW